MSNTRGQRADPMKRKNKSQFYVSFPEERQKQEYLEWEADTNQAVKKLFSKEERLVFYTKYGLKWSSKAVSRRTGLSPFRVKKAAKKIREVYRYDQKEQNVAAVDI